MAEPTRSASACSNTLYPPIIIDLPQASLAADIDCCLLPRTPTTPSGSKPPPKRFDGLGAPHAGAVLGTRCDSWRAYAMSARARAIPSDRLVSRMKGVVEIDAGQHRKHVSLQERDQQVEGDQRDGQRQRCQTPDPTDYAERGAEKSTEPRKHLDRDMTGQHISEQTYAVGERPRQEGDYFDRDNQRQDVDRDARRHEDPEEFQAVFVEAIDQYREEHEQRKRGRNDDLACDREGVGKDADQVCAQ